MDFTSYIHADSKNAEELEMLLGSANDFANKNLLAFLQNDLPDGDLNAMSTAIDEAYELGFIAYPYENAPGYELGVWGKYSDENGPLNSLMVLTEMAKVCGSTAFVMHCQGVATSIVNYLNKNKEFPNKRIALALQDASKMPYVETLENPSDNNIATIKTVLTKNDNVYVLNGKKKFVYMQKDTDLLLIPALLGDKLVITTLPAKAAGLKYEDVGQRTGIRFLELNHITFENVMIAEDEILATDTALDVYKRAISMYWNGVSAIGVGIAQGGLIAARQYASERYQGGKQIEEHAAIQSLIADSYARIEVAINLLKSNTKIDASNVALKNAAITKMHVMTECTQSVTDCLQVFGGYGYMQDYRMEKRLRDIQVLKIGAGSPIFLKKLIFDLNNLEQL